MKKGKILALILKDTLPFVIDQVSGMVSAHLKQKSRDLVTSQMEAQENLIKKIAKKTGKSMLRPTRNIQDIGVSKQQLGRGTWEKIHTTVAALPQDANEDQVKETMNTIKKIIKEFPCIDCHENSIKNLKLIAEKGFSIESVKTRTDAVKWAFDYHNQINADLEKNQFSIEELKENYDF